MNIEIAVSVLAALVAYRVLSSLIDAINPLAFLAKPKMISAQAMSDQAIGASGNA